MKNSSTFLYFRSKIIKLNNSEKFWIMNRMAFELQSEIKICELNYKNYLLENHLSLRESLSFTFSFTFTVVHLEMPRVASSRTLL